jgi:hypothetical protein
MAITRSDFQKLAECRIKDAKALLKQKRWDAAYYLAGYAVECALKACIIRRVLRPDEWFPSPDFSKRCFTHNLDTLRTLANLDPSLEGDGDLSENWNTVNDWNEEKRYEISQTEVSVKDFLQAITDKKHGVLTWLRKHW